MPGPSGGPTPVPLKRALRQRKCNNFCVAKVRVEMTTMFAPSAVEAERCECATLPTYKTFRDKSPRPENPCPTTFGPCQTRWDANVSNPSTTRNFPFVHPRIVSTLSTSRTAKRRSKGPPHGVTFVTFAVPLPRSCWCELSVNFRARCRHERFTSGSTNQPPRPCLPRPPGSRSLWSCD